LSSQATRKDSDNRIKLLKDQLTVFSSDEAQLNKLVDWLEGVNQDLLSFVITPSQSWEVIKLYFISPNVD
jgi:Holliday junction resolvase RusA-like endonuclease